MKMKLKNQRRVNSIFGIYKIGMMFKRDKIVSMRAQLKLETKNISTLNIFSNTILYIIAMEIEYSLYSYTLNFLFIRNDEVYVFFM